MEGPGIGTLVAVMGGVSLGAVLAAMEAGLQALGDVRLTALRDEGGPDARVAARAVRDRVGIRARLLAGRALAVAGATAVAAYAGLEVGGLGLAVIFGLSAAFMYATAAEVAITVARQRASRAALRLLKWLRPLELFLVPLALPLKWVALLTERIVPEMKSQDSARVTELAVEQVIEQGEESGSIDEEHAELLRSVLEFENTVTRQVMVPRTATVAFEMGTPIQEVLTCIVESGHSRYPVYRERIDQIEGMLYAKDLFRATHDAPDLAKISLESVVRSPVFFTPENRKIGQLLREMQSRRVHLAVVVDEFGGTSGIVTLEDILEEIVGEIQDEHDEEELRMERIAEGRYLVDAGISLNDLEDALEEELDGNRGDYDSLGGMVMELAGRVPSVGESIRAGKYDLVVREADERHVTRIELVRRENADDDIEAAE